MKRNLKLAHRQVSSTTLYGSPFSCYDGGPIFIKAFIFTLILCLLPFSFAWSWSKADTGREVLYQGLHLIDWGQTLEVAGSPDFIEKNPVLGDTPSVGSVNLYMGTSAVVHLGISRLVPKGFRPVWQWGTIIGTAYVVARNHYIGIKISF